MLQVGVSIKAKHKNTRTDTISQYVVKHIVDNLCLLKMHVDVCHLLVTSSYVMTLCGGS